MYALLLKRHPCRFWLCREQSPKNIYASHKSRDMYKYNMLYTIKFIEHVLTPESCYTKKTPEFPMSLRRRDRIRTCDFYVPNVALYQAEPHPESENFHSPLRYVITFYFCCLLQNFILQGFSKISCYI